LLAGSNPIKEILRRRIGEEGKVTADGMFSWVEVECLGACCNAPMVQINEDYYEDLTPDNFERLLDDLAAGRPVKTGSQTGRVTSEPIGGLTTLTSFYGPNGRSGPLSAPGSPTPGDYAAALTEYEAQNMPPAEPAVERLKQEAEHSSGRPAGSIVETAAADGGPHQGGPSASPGIEDPASQMPTPGQS
ncbi:MAG: NAD(P)H-dependent oxidoreductase subunit E, partial [Beijerinckiaceae bacterium]